MKRHLPMLALLMTLWVFGLGVSCPTPTPNPPAPAGAVITSTKIPEAVQDKPYSFQFTAKGCARPNNCVWSITGLPPGLSATPKGLISGTPTTDGKFRLEVTVK